MNQLINESLLSNIPCGYALQKMIRDSKGMPNDSLFLQANQLFLYITACFQGDVTNTIASDFFSSKLEKKLQKVDIVNLLITLHILIAKGNGLNLRLTIIIIKRIISNTLLSTAEVSDKSYNIAMDDFLTKPIIKKELIMIFKKYLERGEHGQT